MIDVHTHKAFWAVHKYAGLLACAWLLVVAVTGVLLDHHEWRWLNQISVPASWSSPQVQRITPATIMRHIAVGPSAVLGASERGTWLSTDRGREWRKVRFEGLSGQPQTHGLAGDAETGFAAVRLATDDGLWVMSPDGKTARRLALEGQHVTALSPGHDAASLVAVIDHSRLVRVALPSGAVTPLAVGRDIGGLSTHVPFNSFIREIHFGRGLLAGRGSIWLNDLGGIGLAVLSLTGLSYWAFKRFGNRSGLTVAARRDVLRWLFRAHGPVVGLLAAIPILYLALTAIPLNHVIGFIAATKDWMVPRAAITPAYQGRTLTHEIDGVAAWPDQPGRLTIASRFGVLESRDNGASWRPDTSLPIDDHGAGANVFRAGDRIFVGDAGGKNYVRPAGGAGWVKLSGPSAAISGAAHRGGTWYVKNSRSIFMSDGVSPTYVDSKIPFKSAAPGTPLFLFMADIHTGIIIHSQFKWLSDLFAALAVALAISGPVIWLRRKWV